MIALPSVLLPEPFGPMSACTSPRLITRFTPRRIGLPSTETWRFEIFSVSVITSLQLTASWPRSAGWRRSRSLTGNLLVVEQRRLVSGGIDPTTVVRDGQFVVDLHAHLA